jgi:hypothetical protein
MTSIRQAHKPGIAVRVAAQLINHPPHQPPPSTPATTRLEPSPQTPESPEPKKAWSRWDLFLFFECGGVEGAGVGGAVRERGWQLDASSGLGYAVGHAGPVFEHEVGGEQIPLEVDFEGGAEVLLSPEGTA